MITPLTLLTDFRDASGQEKYIHLCENFFRAANGAIFVYNVNKRQSFQNLKKWIKKVKDHAKGINLK